MSPIPLRVLIVDDNVDAATSLALVIQAWGHQSRFVHDGLSGVEAAQQFAPHVAILDIGLPVLDGFEVAGRIRALEGWRPLRLVALSGYHQEQFRRRSKDTGFDDYLVKPVDMAVLRRLLESVKTALEATVERPSQTALPGPAAEIPLPSITPEAQRPGAALEGPSQATGIEMPSPGAAPKAPSPGGLPQGPLSQPPVH